MKQQIVAVVFTAALATASTAAMAHHSFAMFDQEHKSERQGIVKEFKFNAPHVFIMMEVKESDGSSNMWALEGEAPTALVRAGWNAKSLKPGDEIKLIVAPLRSGAAGGSWVTKEVTFGDGKPIAVAP